MGLDIFPLKQLTNDTTGPTGPRGKRGVAGPTGERGVAGPTGPDGGDLNTEFLTGSSSTQSISTILNSTYITNTDIDGALFTLDVADEDFCKYIYLANSTLPVQIQTNIGSFLLTPVNPQIKLAFINNIWVQLSDKTPWFPVTQRNKLIGTGIIGTTSDQGSVSLSADGSTLAIGGWSDDSNIGATWVFVRDSGGNWSQQGAKLVGNGSVGASTQGDSVSISADGNTLAVGGLGDDSYVGATWVFVRDSGGNWSQQGAKLVGNDSVGASRQGDSISISADGDTLAVGGWTDDSNIGATWVFVRDSGGNWSQQGAKLVATDGILFPRQGNGVSLSANGNTLAVGGITDDSNIGATWIYTRTAGVWNQQTKLIGTDTIGGTVQQGFKVLLSANGSILFTSSIMDDSNVGAVWVFINQGGTWQQHSKLVGTGSVGGSRQGFIITSSSDGSTFASGGWTDDSSIGATWLFVRNPDGYWYQKESKIVASGAIGNARQGAGVSLSADGNTLAIGGQYDDSNIGATWIFS